MEQNEDVSRSYMDEILQYLKKHGDRSDKEVAETTGIPLSDVHIHLSELKDKKQIMVCNSTRLFKGNGIESTICRISEYIPPNKPGAKAKAQTA